MGRAKIRESQGSLKGDGLALAGLIIAYIGLALFLIGIIAAISIPHFAHYMEQMK